MFDTHCHLNFKAFGKNVRQVISDAKSAGVQLITVPGTDRITSAKAVTLASEFTGVYAAVGIHPHHIYELRVQNSELRIRNELKEIVDLLKNPKTVAVGEVGIDRYCYRATKYKEYLVDEAFIELQRKYLKEQIRLALEYKRGLILHNREARKDILALLSEVWDQALAYRVVFHCCEPDRELLEFAKEHKIFIGVDGDVTFDRKKQEFVKNIPPDFLVLETDSPYLTPEPVRTVKRFPNEPKNLSITASYIAQELNLSIDRVDEITTENGRRLFRLP